MLDYTKVESRLKSFLKNNKRLGYSVALLVTFLINGDFSYADEVVQAPTVRTRLELQDKIVQEQDNISQMIKDTDKNVSDIELKIKKLTQRGEFWVKPLDKSYQVFLLASVGNYTKNKNKTEENFTEPEYRNTRQPSSRTLSSTYTVKSRGISVLSAEKEETKPTYRGNYNYKGNNYGDYGIIKNPLEFIDKIDFGANISPKGVEEKAITEKTVKEKEVPTVNVSVPSIDVATVTVETPTPPSVPGAPNPSTPIVNVTAPGTVPTLGTITVGAIPTITVTASAPTVGAAPTVNAPTVQAPATPAGFTPKLITAPEKPNAPAVVTPTDFNPPDINFKGKGFNQGAAVSMPKSNIVLQNYDTYDTVDKNNNATKGILNIEVGNLGGGVRSKWWGTNLDGTANPNIQIKAVTNVPNAVTPGLTKGNFSPLGAGTFYLGDGQSSSALNAFINELRDHNATLSGNYVLTNRGGEGDTNRNIIFLSHNPAGVGNGTGPGTPGGPYDGQAQAGEKRAIFDGTLTLNGTATPFTGSTASSEVTIGVEHQLWSKRASGDWITVGAYSTFENKGLIHLNKGNNLVGILIDVEAWNNNDGPAHKTINNGTIKITAGDTTNDPTGGNSIGIDYGEFNNQTFKSELTVGNIIVAGSKNYGLRMANIFTGNNAYFDKGTTIKSGGVGKKILVQGKKNVGVSIAKFLSTAANANPIANISDLNVTLAGEESIGFLRNKNYSSNNTNDMVFDSTTMGIFELGKGAKNSTLIRTDKYGIQVRKDISSTGKDDDGKDNTGTGNTVLHANGKDQHIYNYNTITVGSGFVKTVGMAATETTTDSTIDNIVNEGTIELQGKQSIGMYVDEHTKGKTTQNAVIKMTGQGDKDSDGNVGDAGNVGISNKGNFEFLGTIEVNGKKSSGIYNIGTTKIKVGSAPTDITKITANEGAIGLYSKGIGTKIESTADNKLEINVNAGTTKEGLAAYAEGKSSIILKKAKINVDGGAAGVAAFDTGSNIDLEEATLTYKGSGYAIYSDGKGTVNLKKSTINLLGGSTAFDVDLNLLNLPTILDSATRINAKSDDVVAFNLKNASGLTTVGGLVTNPTTGILKKIQDKLPSGVNLTDLFEYSTADKYKIAAADGGSITIGSLDKSGVSTDTTGAKKDGFEYFNRFLAQRMVATTNANSKIKAVLTTQDAKDRYNNQVVGFEMNSSSKASTNAEAAIKLVQSKIIADRDGEGNGAIGAFINYGKVLIDKDSAIEVEKETGNTPNNKAVGVYSVNGSEVTNEGTIEVGGKQSVGILGMAYRTKADGTPVGAEFGSSASNQGKIKIINDGSQDAKIKMSGKNAIGIYAKNNNSTSNVSDHIVENSGEITVGKSDGGTAVGIYADKVTVKPKDGNINIGKGAVGIFATPKTVVGASGDALGKITYAGNNGVAIYLEGNSTDDSKLEGTKLTLSDDPSILTPTTGKIGIFSNLENTSTFKQEIDASTAKNVIAYYSAKKDMNVEANITLSEGSTGVTGAIGKKLAYGNDINPYILKVGKKSTGIVGDNDIIIGSKTNIKLSGNEGSIGAYATGASGRIVAKGKLTFENEKSTGLFARNGATIEETGANYDLDFTASNAKKNTGIYLAGAKWIGRNSAITFNSNHEKGNIYLFAQGSKEGTTTFGNTITLNNVFNVNPGGTASVTNKAIGMYLDTNVKGTTDKFVENTLDLTNSNAKINVTSKGIGVYAKNSSNTVNNTIKLTKISSDGNETVGVYADGNIKLAQANGKIEAKNKGIGLYGSASKVTLETGTTEVRTTAAGTGLYLTNGSYLTNNKLSLKNNTVGTAAAGVYYTKGTNTNELTHNTELEVASGSNDLLAMYLDGGVKVKNVKAITSDTGANNVATFVTGGSILTNDADITVGSTGSTMTNGIGVYVKHGEATNNTSKTIKVTDGNAALSVAMLAAGASATKTAKVTNSGTVEATGNVIGMNINNYSTGVNSLGATITATNDGTNKAIGAYVKGENASFENAGNISSGNIALAIEDTAATKITNTGTINLTANNAVGVYAKNSIIDFKITATSTKQKTVALFAKADTSKSTKIRSAITSAGGAGNIGVYVEDSRVKFETGSSVTVKDGTSTDYGVGIYSKEGYNGTIKTDINQVGQYTIGLFAGSNGGTGSTITHEGTINVGTGIGVFVPKHSSFTANNTTFKVNGGTAVFLKGGAVDLGSTGNATIAFGNAGGTAIYQDGGTITTGSNLTITGKGSFLALKNANSTINSTTEVGKNGIGINATYDSNASNYALTLGSNGNIKLNGEKATGISAIVNGVSPNKVTITNNGVIETVGNNEQTAGVIGKGSNVINTGKINIGKKGTAIYTDNSGADINTKTENTGEINLIGDEAKGIVGINVNTTQDIITGKIKGTKDKLVGAFFKNSNPVTIKNTNIKLGTNAKGLVFDTTNFTVTSSSGKNEVKVARTTDNANRAIGIAALGSTGTIANTNVIVGSKTASGSASGDLKQSMGLYVNNGGVLTFDSTNGELKSAGGETILAYADNGTINLNGGRTLQVGANSIAIGTNGGTVNADTTTQIQVNGSGGIGAYIKNGNVSNNFDVKVNNASGRGVYATGTIGSLAKVSDIKGNNSIGYILENVTTAVNLASPIQLNDTSATGQFGVVAKGTGAGLTVSGISVSGNKNIGVSNETTGTVTNTGTLTVADSNDTNNSSIGIYSNGGKIVSTGAAIVGKNSLGIYGKGTAVTSGAMTIADNGVGIQLDNTSTSQGSARVNGSLTVGGNGAVGLQVANANTTVNGDINIANGDSKGIYSNGAGNITATGNVSVGDNSVGVYQANGSGTVTVGTSGLGNTLTVGNNAYGIFSNGSAVINHTNVNVASGSGSNQAIGVYVNGNSLTSTGTVTVGNQGVGLLVKGAGNTLTSTGALNVGSNNAVGLYADRANISQTGVITTAADNGIGIYSKGAGSVATNGNITVGKNSIGIYKVGKGTMNIGLSNQTLSIGDQGYGIYHLGNSSSDSVINSNMSMTLGKEGVGIYGKNTTVNQNGDITVGETTIGTNGYNDPGVNKNSIGVFAENSNVNYSGTMNVNHPLSVGIYGKGSGTISLQNAILNVTNGATGIMTGKGVTAVNIGSGSIINVDGKATSPDASSGNVSFGIAAYSGSITNNGTINISNGATGIYVAGTATLTNKGGTININAGGGTPLGDPGTAKSADIGGVKVTNRGEVTIGGRVINGGTLNIQGSLTMAGMGIDITGTPIIDAHSIAGVAYVLPNFSKGNSEQKLTIPNVFRTGGIGLFSGEIRSKSVSWIAKISSPTNAPREYTKDITMARIPYTSLIGGTRYVNLSKGMEEVRQKINTDSSSDIFKSFDKIDSHKKFAEAVADVRGDVYSNIQERMKTVEGAFDKSYDELLDSYNKTRNVNKFSVIQARGEHKDGTLGVTGYKYNSTGVLYVNDREGFIYGGKYGWSAGIVGSNFKFNDETSKGSKERVISGKLGLHYQTALNKADDNARLKWLTRGELTVNNHRTKRHSQIGADTYLNKAHFYSAELSWKNKIFYDYDINTEWIVKPYVGLDLAYGHIFGIKETGNELNLEVKTKDYYEVVPNVGVETKYTLPIGAIHQVFVKADVEARYDVTKLYRDTNKAKIKNSSTGYYKLSEPERRRARVAIGAELGFEKENTYGITFRTEYQGYKKSQLNYGIRLNYKF